MLAPTLLLFAALAASGVLYKHKSLLTFLSLAGLLWEAAWLFITLLDRTFFEATPSSNVFIFFSGMALLAALYAMRTYDFTFPVKAGWYNAKLDIAIISVCALVGMAAFSVWNRNGFEDHAWVSHSFFNGDTSTFISLVQRSFHTDGLVSQNPFNANGSLEYPSLLHAGVASFFSQLGITSGSGWLNLLPVMTYAFIILTIPAFFLVLDVTLSSKPSMVAMGGIVLYTLALSWDGYVYPQSHFFLTGLFVILVFLLLHPSKPRLEAIQESIALATVAVLLFSNAVTGVAAAGLYIARTFWKPSTFSIVACVGVIALYFIASPGNASISTIHFSYVATDNMLRLFPAIAVLFVVLLRNHKSYPLQSLAVTLLSLAAFGIFFFSDRGIVRENASRFFYHAVLVTFPLLGLALPYVTKQFQATYKEFRKFTPVTVPPMLLLLVLGGFLILPAGASVISTHDNLWRKDKQVIDTAHRLALWWIEDNTAPDALFAANPKAPFAIPAFTGRSLLRTNYWLSNEDAIHEDLVMAMNGDKAAQEKIFPLVDYIYVTQEERQNIEPLSEEFEKVFDSNAIVIYKTAR